MRKRGYFILCGLVLSLGAAPALTHAGWGGGPGGGEGHGRHGGHGGFGGLMMGGGPDMFMHMILRKLTLTPDQETKIHEMMENRRTSFKQRFQDLETVQNQIGEKFFAGDSTPEQLNALRDQAKATREALMDEGFDVALKIRALLDEKQLAQAAQLWQQMQTMRAQMRSFFDEKQ
jgi:Spy/CpxP family protein refolding chaperone